jgi:hypothetical protein
METVLATCPQEGALYLLKVGWQQHHFLFWKRIKEKEPISNGDMRWLICYRWCTSHTHVNIAFGIASRLK